MHLLGITDGNTQCNSVLESNLVILPKTGNGLTSNRTSLIVCRYVKEIEALPLYRTLHLNVHNPFVCILN